MSLEAIFGIYPYHGYIMQILLAESLFLPLLIRRKKFWARLALGLPLYLFLSYISANLLQFVVSELTSFTIFLFSFALGAFLFKNRFRSLLFLYVGAQVIQNLSHNVEGLIYVPFAERFDLLGQFFLSVGVMIVVYTIAYFVVVRRLEKSLEDVPARGAILLAVFSMVFCYLVQTLMKRYLQNLHWVALLPLIFCDVITIAFAYLFASYLSEEDKKKELERLIAQTDGYYEMVGANIEALNIKAHDLKHFLENAKSKELDQEGLLELQKVLGDYENLAKTGNRALDNVLSNYTVLFSSENIPFTYNVDAEALSFLKPGDLTSIFGNLLSNALEAERKVEEKGKTYVGLKVSQKGEMTSIHVENYWQEKVVFKKGLPISTKGDAINHGYGTRSVFYLSGKYGGTVSFSHTEDIFEANLLFPKQIN